MAVRRHDKRRGGPTRVSPAAYLVALLLSSLLPPASAGGGDVAPSLIVTNENGRVLVRFDLSTEPRWHLAWNHSVTGILVRDFYEFRDGTMLLTDSHTPAYDAGLGHIPGRGRAESDGRGGYWIRGLNEPVPGNAYWLRVGALRVAHTLVHDGFRTNLSELAAGQRVRIAVVAP